jgi:hypothetical protein
MLKSFKFVPLFLCIFLSGVTAYCQETAVLEAKVNKNKVATGEIFTYTVKISGQFTSPKIKLPEFKNFIIVSRSEQRTYSAKSTGMLFEEKLILNLLCPKPGVFTIEGFNVEDKGKKLTSNSVTIEASGKPLEEKPKKPPYTGKGIDI